MNSKFAIALMLSLLLVSVATSTYFASADVSANNLHATPKPTPKPTPTPTPTPEYKTFTATLSGTAQDINTHKTVPVSLSMNGKADGTLKCVVDLYVKGGTLQVANYGGISASSGSGFIISSCNYVSFYVTFTGKYGGQTTCWFLDGKIISTKGNTLTISLNDNCAVLPLQGCPTLKNVALTGTVTLSY